MQMFVVVIDRLVGSGESSTPEVHNVPSDDVNAVKVLLKLLGEPKDSDTIIKVYKVGRGAELIQVSLDPHANGTEYLPYSSYTFDSDAHITASSVREKMASLTSTAPEHINRILTNIMSKIFHEIK